MNEFMRIGMILDDTFPPDARVENEAVTLVKEGHEVFLYCHDYEGDKPKEEVIQGIEVRRYFVPQIIYKLSALAYTLPLYHLHQKRVIREFLTTNQIEIVHIHDIRIARSLFMLRDEIKLPLVLDLHENRPEIMKFYSHVNTKSGQLLIKPAEWKKFEYKYIREADQTIVITEQAKQYYEKEINNLGKEIAVVPNTVRKAFYTSPVIDESILRKYEDEFAVLYLGDTGLRRGIETLIHATALLAKKIPNLKVVIVGKNKTDHILYELIAKLELEKSIDMEGWKDFSLFPSYIKSCKIGVCPIHQNIHHNTTFANKIFQYLSLGKPIVVSDCEAQQKVAENYSCGLVHKDRDATDLADKIYELYTDKSLYQELSSNATEAIENHLNWETISTELKEIYSNGE